MSNDRSLTQVARRSEGFLLMRFLQSALIRTVPAIMRAMVMRDPRMDRSFSLPFAPLESFGREFPRRSLTRDLIIGCGIPNSGVNALRRPGLFPVCRVFFRRFRRRYAADA